MKANKTIKVSIELSKSLWIILNQRSKEQLRNLEQQIVWELMKDEAYVRVNKNIKKWEKKNDVRY